MPETIISQESMESITEGLKLTVIQSKYLDPGKWWAEVRGLSEKESEELPGTVIALEGEKGSTEVTTGSYSAWWAETGFLGSEELAREAGVKLLTGIIEQRMLDLMAPLTDEPSIREVIL